MSKVQGAAEHVLCVHHVLDNGIHEFVFREASREAFDEFILDLGHLVQGLAPGESALILVDWRQSGVPPLRYAFQRSREHLRHYPNHGQGKTAMLYRQDALISLAQTFVDLLNKNSRARFFGANQYDAAVCWLLECEVNAG